MIPHDDGTPDGGAYSGQEYDRRDRPPALHEQPPARSKSGEAIPPEAGHRGTIADNGEVHGSGAGAGGGNPGEDYDSDAGGDLEISHSPRGALGAGE